MRTRELFRLACTFGLVLSMTLFLAACGGGTTEPGTPEPGAGPETVPTDPAPEEPGSAIREDISSAVQGTIERAREAAEQAAQEAEEGVEEAAEVLEASREEVQEAVQEMIENVQEMTDAEPLDSETIVGTKWSVAGIQIEFQEDGKLSINESSTGGWELEDDTLTLTFNGQTYTAKIDGAGITYEGAPLLRVN
jgi:hypothetical protein